MQTKKTLESLGVGRCPWGVPRIYIHAYTFWGENGCKPVRAAALKSLKANKDLLNRGVDEYVYLCLIYIYIYNPGGYIVIIHMDMSFVKYFNKLLDKTLKQVYNILYSYKELGSSRTTARIGSCVKTNRRNSKEELYDD